MELHLIRHGHDPDGYRGGWSMRGLDALGYRQAHLLAQRLRRERFRADTLLCSDLPGAVQTGEVLAQALGLPLLPRPAWREVNNGVLAGMANTEAERRYPGLYWRTLEANQPYPGGESPAQFHRRVVVAFDELCRTVERREAGPRVVVVTHGGVIEVIAALLHNVEWSNKQRRFPTGDTSLHSFARRDGVWSALRLNDMRHLAPERAIP